MVSPSLLKCHSHAFLVYFYSDVKICGFIVYVYSNNPIEPNWTQLEGNRYTNSVQEMIAGLQQHILLLVGKPAKL